MAADFSVPDWLADRSGSSAPADPPDPAEAEREAMHRYGRILSASAAASRALAGLDGRFAQDTGFADAPLRYREELEAIGRDQEAALGGDPVGRALFRRDFTRLADHAARRFELANAQREAAHWARTLEERWDSLAALARGADGEGRAEILRQAAVEAHRARSFGLVPDANEAFHAFLDRLGPGEEIGPRSSSMTSARSPELQDGAGDGRSAGANSWAEEEGVIFDTSKQKPKPPRRLPPTPELRVHGELAHPYDDPAHAAFRSPVNSVPPAWRAKEPAVKDHWKPFNDAVGHLPGVSDMERHVYGRIFAAEGGMKKNPKSSAFAGIMSGTLRDLKGTYQALAGFPGVPKDLSHVQVAAVYRHYLNDALNGAGGVRALDQVGDWDTAAAIGDVLFREGRTGGAQRVGEALGAVVAELGKTDEAARLGLQTYEAGQIVGPQSIAVIRTLERAGYGAMFRDALIQARINGPYGNERERIEAFR